MWKKEYAVDCLLGTTRRQYTYYKHPLGYVATHDTLEQRLVIREKDTMRQVAEDFRLMDEKDALTCLNRDYD